MNMIPLKPGDVIYAKEDILNDGSHPELPENAVIAAAGTRGVLVNTGEIEIDEETKEKRDIFLARFEDDNLELGPPVGCWPEEVISLAEWEAQNGLTH